VSAIGHIVSHYVEQLAQRAKLTGFREARVEIEGAALDDAQELEQRQLQPLRHRIEQVASQSSDYDADLNLRLKRMEARVENLDEQEDQHEARIAALERRLAALELEERRRG
jgi:TolA-binding protein